MNNKLKRNGKYHISVIIVLLTMFIVVTYALFRSEIFINDNEYVMGEVKIDLNHGEKIFDFVNIAPNDVLEREFTITNLSPIDIYYQLYLTDIDGELSEQLIFEIYDENKLMDTFNASEFSESNPYISKNILSSNEEKTLKIKVYFLKQADNSYQGEYIHFDITAKGVQAKNNEQREFGE